MLFFLTILHANCQASLDVQLLNSVTQAIDYAPIVIVISGYSGSQDFIITGTVSSDDVPIICQNNQILATTPQTLIIERMSCQSFKIRILQSMSPLTIYIQNYQVYLAGQTFLLQLNIFYLTSNVEKNYDFQLVPQYYVFMQNYQYYFPQNYTGSQSSLWFTYKPLTYLVADSYMQLNLQFRDNYNTPANIPIFSTQSPLCVGLIGVNQNLSCQVKGSQLFVYNLVNQMVLLQNLTLIIYNFTTSQALQNQIRIQIFFFQKMVQNYYQLQKSPIIRINPLLINSNVEVQISQTNDIVSQQNKITFQIQYSDFLYDWTNILLTIPSNYQSNLASLIINSEVSMKSSPTLTYSGNQIVITKCLSQFLNAYQQIKFSVDVTNPDLVNSFAGFKILLQDGNLLQNIAQSSEYSIKTKSSILQNVQILLKSQKVGTNTSYTFVFNCNTNLPSGTYLQIIISPQIQFQSDGLIQDCTNVNQASQLVFSNQQLTINKWVDNQIMTSNTQRNFTITNIRNPLRMQDNVINYQLFVYQSDNQIHDSTQGQLNLTLEQTQLQVLSSQFIIQTTNAISDLNIQFISEVNLQEQDQMIIQFNIQDFDFSLMTQSIVCSVNQITSTCFKFQAKIYIQIQSNLTTLNNIITIQNHVSVRSLKQSQIQLLLRRSGYQIASSNPFIFQSQLVNNFIQFEQQEIYQSPNYTYKYLIKSQIKIQIGEILEIQLPFQYKSQLIETTINSSFQVIDNKLQLTLIQEVQSMMLYYIYIRNVDTQSNVSQVDATFKTQDNFHILKSVYNIQQVTNYPKILPKFINVQDNQYINSQNTILFIFQSNFNLTDQNYGILSIPIEFSNIIDIQLNDQLINYTIQDDETNHKIMFNFTNNTSNQDIKLTLKNITNPKQVGIRFMAILDLYESSQQRETGMTIINSYICNNNCKQCDLNNNCIQCQDSWFLRNQVCVQQCQLQDILVGLECIPCNLQIPCRYCNQQNKNECSLCQGDLILNEGVCVNQQYNITKEQPYNNTVILKGSNYQESLFDKLYYSFFLYFNVIVLIVFIARKIIRKKFKFISGYLSYIGICDPIAQLISLVSFILNNQQYQTFVSGGLLILRMIYLINSQIIIIPQLQTEKIIQRLLYKSNALKLIMMLTKFYDWKISFILNSKLSQQQIFCLKFNNEDQINKNYMKILYWSFIYINPLNIIILILSVSTDQYNTSVFQFEYMIFLLMSQLVSIVKTYQFELVKGSNIISEEQSYQ